MPFQLASLGRHAQQEEERKAKAAAEQSADQAQRRFKAVGWSKDMVRTRPEGRPVRSESCWQFPSTPGWCLAEKRHRSTTLKEVAQSQCVCCVSGVLCACCCEHSHRGPRHGKGPALRSLVIILTSVSLNTGSHHQCTRQGRTCPSVAQSYSAEPALMHAHVCTHFGMASAQSAVAQSMHGHLFLRQEVPSNWAAYTQPHTHTT